MSIKLFVFSVVIGIMLDLDSLKSLMLVMLFMFLLLLGLGIRLFAWHVNEQCLAYGLFEGLVGVRWRRTDL